MEDKLVLAQRSKKSLSRYIVSTGIFVIAAVVFYLITYVFETVAEGRVFTFTAIIALSIAAFVYYGILLIRILLMPSELIVLREGELTVKGRVRINADQVRDVTRRYGIGSSPKFSYGRLVIITRDNKRVNVYEVEDVSAVIERMHEVLGIE